MSMLAERRRKTKWVINPTKKPLWATDSNGIKFGKELMEKMGWSAGKGLGAKEQGIQEPLRVSYKNDTKGMGFKGNDDDWIEQQDEFNVLLNQLWNSDDSSVVKVSEEEKKKNEIKSLEEKSRQSRARVHYQKFTRGKDLSRYSENDLACILGTNKVKKEKSKSENVVESEENTDGQLVTSFGVTTINSGSIQDYFKRKWTTDKVQSKRVSDVEKEKEEHSCDERPSFSRVLVENSNLESKEYSKGEDKKEDGNEMSGESGEKYEKKKKKRKKDGQRDEEEEPKSKRKNTSDQDYPVDEEFQNTAAGVASDEIENLSGNENDCDSSRKRKKEKRKSKRDERNDGSEEANLGEVKKKKKKERKEKPSEDGGCDAAAAGELTSINCNLEAGYEEREGGLVKKEKKGKPVNEVLGEFKKDSVEELSLEVSMGEANSVVDGEFVVAKEKKKKQKYKDHSGNVGVDVDSVRNDALGKVSNFSEGDPVEAGSKKKKKKKKEREDGEMGCCGNENGISFHTLVEECYGGSKSGSTAESEERTRKKKKKKERQEGNKIECHDSNENGPSGHEKPDDGNNSSDAVELGEVKKKKKKKEEKLERQGNDNVVEIPAERWDSVNNSNSTVELDEVKKKKKKKEKEEEEGKREQQNKENEIFIEMPLPAEKLDSVNNSNSTMKLAEVKKKKKKKEKKEEEEEEEEGKREQQNKENEIFSEIPLERSEVGKNSKSSTELGEPKKRKKKDKHRRKEEESGSKESGLEEGHREAVNGSSERVDKKKKRKERKGEECRGEEEEEERDSGAKREKKEEKRGEEGGKGGNAEVGTRAGIDRVEMICQRAAYEHVGGVHRQERVKRMIECVNLARFRGSNLECLDGYGNSWRKCETSVT